MTPPVPPLAPGQQPPTQPQFLTGAQLNMRIQQGDPAFPNELWGRTVGEAMRYYSIMREDFKQRNSPAAQPAPPAAAAQPAYQPAQPPPAPTYPAARPPYVPAQAPAAPEPAFNEERLLARVGELVRAELGKSPATLVAADMVKNQMRSKFPDFIHYEQQVMEELRGTDPNTLANPDLWETTYFYVRGRASATGQGLPQAPAPSAAPVQGPRGEWVSPPPAPPGMHFVESPAGTPPASAGSGAPDPRNDPSNLQMARRFGIPIDEYVQWMHGNVPTAGNGR